MTMHPDADCELCGQQAVGSIAINDKRSVAVCVTHVRYKIKEITLALGEREANETEISQGLGPGQTPRRTIRVPDSLWEPAAAKAEEEGTELSVVLRRGLEGFLKAKPKKWDDDATAARNPIVEKVEA